MFLAFTFEKLILFVCYENNTVATSFKRINSISHANVEETLKTVTRDICLGILKSDLLTFLFRFSGINEFVGMECFITSLLFLSVACGLS